MSVYLDASVLVAIFTDDPHSSRADRFLLSQSPMLIVSDFAAAEFASAIGRRVRMAELLLRDAYVAFSTFDAWVARTARWVETAAADVAAASAFLRRLDLTLRTPDALNLATASRLGADFATFDERLAANAKALGLTTVPI